MQIRWLSGKLEGPQIVCKVPGRGHSQAPDPAGASTKGPGWEQLVSFSQLPNIIMYPAVLPTAPEATKLKILGNEFCLVCMLSLRADGRLAGSGPELPAKLAANFSAAPATASHGPLTLQGCQAEFCLGGLP
eukprot:247965-Pelagomonas_calceolata.AAC.10